MKKILTTILFILITFFSYSKTTKETSYVMDSLGNITQTITTSYSEGSEALKQIIESNQSTANIQKTFVTIFIAVLIFLAVTLIPIGYFYYKNKERKEKYKLIEKAIDKGMTLPDDVFVPKKKKEKHYEYYIVEGIPLLALGAGFLIYTGASKSSLITFCGYIIMMSGIAFLAIGIFEKRRQKNEKSKKTDEHSENE